MTRKELFEIRIPQAREEISRQIKDNWNRVAKPLDGLGRLETMICRIGSAQNSQIPGISPRAILILCADNGIVAEGVSQSGQEVTLAVARNMGNRSSSVCKMAALAGVETTPVDIGINSDEEIPGVQNRKVMHGTKDFLKEPAMTEEEVLAAIDSGIRLVRECQEQGIRILATGEMGIGNTTTSTAVTAGILSLNIPEITGRGAGLDKAGIRRKAEVIRQGLEKYGFSGAGQAEEMSSSGQLTAGSANVSPELTAGSASISPELTAGSASISPELTAGPASISPELTPDRAFEILRCVGGLDIAGLCGVFIGGAVYRIPVVIDGLISAAAALCADSILPSCRQFMLASHIGAEPGMRYILQHLGLQEVIHGDLALGEGTGAVMLFPLLDMAMEVYRGSSTFEEIGVDQYQRHD